MVKIEAIALCRVSTAEQKIEGHSLERQEANVFEYASRMNCEIVKVWSLDTSSKAGVNFNRKDLKQIIDFCRTNKKVKFLFVDETDRFMRSVPEFWYFEGKLKFEFRVKTIYVSQPNINDDSDTAMIQKTFDVLRAHLENSKRREKSINGLKARVAAGYYPFMVHAGYMKSDTPGLHIPNPEPFKMLQEAFQEVLSGIYTPNEALKRLGNRGYRTRAGRPLKIDKFINILSDEYYTGVIDMKGEINIRTENALHEAMISKEAYQKLQEILGKRPRRSSYERKHYNPEFPLQKIDIYHECKGHKALTGAWKSNGKGKKYANYRCLACGKEFKRDEIHEAINKILSQTQLSDDYRKKFLKALIKVYDKKQADNINRLSHLSKKVKEYKGQIDSLVLKLANTDSKLEKHIESAIQNLESKIDLTEQEKNLLSKQQEEIIDFVEFTLNYIDKFQSKWWSMRPEDRKRCQELLFPEGITLTSDKKIGTLNLALLYRLATNKKELRIARNSLLVELEGIAPSSIRTSI